MAQKNPAPYSLLKKVVATLLVILVYAIPFYQDYASPPEEHWPNLKVTAPLAAESGGGDAPYFAENFVNQARTGVICHVSSIAAAGEDRLICTWYAGSKEAALDVAVYAAFFQEKTGRWSEPEILVDRTTSSTELRRWVRKVGNAVVMNDGRGGLWLFYASLLGGWSSASLNYKVSRNEGRTWSASRKLILSPFFNLTSNVKNKGLSLSQGAFLLPAYHELLGKFSQALLIRPGEANLRYEVRRMTYSGKAVQPAFIPRTDQTLLAFFRNAAGGGKSHILRAESPDVGRDWSELTATPLPNPDSGFDMIPVADGAILGVVNRSFQDRDNLTLVLSRDGGKTWTDLYILENTPGKEYAYPSLTRSGPYYHLTYSYERSRIKHVVFNDAWLGRLGAYAH